MKLPNPLLCLLPAAVFATATPVLLAQPVFQTNGTTLVMSNGNAVVQYNLLAGTANFYWQNALVINSFYAGVQLTNYVTGNTYATHTASIIGNTQAIVTSTSPTLPTLKQYFSFYDTNSFLTRVEVDGSNLSSAWMGPLVMSTTGGVDLGSYQDDRALQVPWDNDHFVTYNAMPLNSTATGYEAAAFYDNTTRVALVVGSVTHDTWKTGVYWSGSNNKLNALNVFGGQAAPWDVLPHGPVTGNSISSPTVFVGFGPDWRTMLETFASANAAQVPKLPWTNGVPFGWNSWYAFGTTINYTDAITVSDFIKNNLQTNHFNDNGVVYVNLDSYWSNLNSSQLADFVQHCHANGQKAGIYWTPFVYWGTAAQGSNTTMTGTSYTWSQAYLLTTNGTPQINDGGIALDPTHPGSRQIMSYYANLFLGYGFDYIKLDFLSHGALEGVHYATNVTTGIQAYNQGMQYLVQALGGTMFISESIAPLFPYNYGNSRRIACDTAKTISETEYEMQSVNYGWWLSGRCYDFNDPDLMEFAGASTNENQSRLISGVVSGTVFLNSDNLTNSTDQALAITCLTNAALNSLAAAGQTFRPVEGNTGTNAGAEYVSQVGTNWYVAVFNFTSSAVTQTNALGRAGVPAGTIGALDLWSGSLGTVTSNSLVASLAAKQSKLFQLVFTPSFALSVSPALQTVRGGGSTNFTINITATAAFTNAIALSVTGLPAGASAVFSPGSVPGSGASTLTVTVSNLVTSGSYPLSIQGVAAGLTNSASALLLVGRGAPANLRWNASTNSAWDYVSSNWFNLGSGMSDQFYPGDTVLFDDTPGVLTSVSIGSGVAVSPAAFTNSSSVNNFTFSGAGSVSGALTLNKTGTSTLTLGTVNSFAGAVNVQSGILKLAATSALGATNNSIFITNGGTLDLGGYGIGLQALNVSGAGANGNGAVINSGGPVYDNGSGLAKITLTGNATFGGPTRWDMGGSSGAVLSTGGEPYSVTFLGVPNGIYFEWYNVTADAALASINVMPGATLGDKGTTTLGNSAQPINVFSNASLTFYLSGSLNVLNKAVALYDGATMKNDENATVAIQPITLGTNVLGGAGNCTVSVPYTSLTFSNAVIGPGNLIKTGSQPLKLAGTNTFTGMLSINAATLSLLGQGSIKTTPLITVASGAVLDVSGRSDDSLTLMAGQNLQGSGSVNGKLTVSTGATVTPGLSGAGTLTASNAATLQGTTAMTLGASTNTVLAASNINYGGVLSLTLTAGTPQTGNSFALFNAPNKVGVFSAITPSQPGLGLKWDTNQLASTGVLGVLALPRPVITGASILGAALVLRGTNGTPGYSCRLLFSTNAALPFNRWAILSTNQFDANGNFACTNAYSAPAEFFALQAI